MRRLLQLVFAAAILVATGAGFAAALFYALVLSDLPDIRSLQDYHPNLITRVYSADGSVVGEFYKERREIVPIERIPAFVVQAFIAIEDDSFYTHEGLDYPGIARAAWRNLVAGEVKQGGSTITQQVAKTFLLSSERTWVRKLKDMVLARRIEQHLDKNEILYLYLNQIYLGSGAYGVQAASKIYFGKFVDQLTLAEAALIAGVVPAPSRYSPFTNPELARQRQRMALRRMREEGFITVAERKTADEEPWKLVAPVRQPDLEAAAYFAEEVRRYLYERFGSDTVLTGGLEVRTTLDLKLQRAAWNAVRSGLREHDRRRGWRGPVRKVAKAEREAEQETLTLGAHGEAMLTLDDVAWAAPPNPEQDGLGRKITRISAALARGDVVRLETKTGVAGTDGAPPATEFSLYQEPQAQGALLSFELPSGRVQALVGGYDYQNSEFDRALQSKRQPGSAFKPIVYAAALERGYTPARIVLDTPVVYDDPSTGATWKPENYTEEFYGPITMREALAQSRNIATIRILQDIGLPPVLDLAQSLGIARALGSNLSLALGTSEVTLAELSRAYAIFGSSGRWVEPVFIVEVRDRKGEVLERGVPLVRRADPDADGGGSAPADTLTLDDVLERMRSRDGADGRPALPAGHVMDPVTAYLITDMMKAVITEGTGRRARELGRPLAGKTGTTNDLFDAWFVGFSPQVVTGTWIGYDNVRSLGKNETGSRAALPIWIDYMREAVQRHPPSEFAEPPGVVFARIDKKTGLLAAPGADEYVFQAFREGSEPTEFATTANANGTHTRPRLD